MKRDLASEKVAVLTQQDGAYIRTRLDGRERLDDVAQWLGAMDSAYDCLLMLEPNPEMEEAAKEKVIILYDDEAED